MLRREACRSGIASISFHIRKLRIDRDRTAHAWFSDGRYEPTINERICCNAKASE